MKLDIRWITLPIMSILAYNMGDVNLWIIILIIIGSFKLTIKL